MVVKERLPSRKEKGQALIIIAVAFLVLLAFVGLAVDVGQLFIAMGNLRRAADAGALAAAAQFREGRSEDEMAAVARQVIALNGLNPSDVEIKTCRITSVGDPDYNELGCGANQRRKLVKIYATAEVSLSFLAVIGIHHAQVSATATSEAASMDVVLVIDISESMAFDGIGQDRDPSYCNANSSCQPFEAVREAASEFIGKILDKNVDEEEDRLAIITFANGWSSGLNQGTHFRPNGVPYWTSDRAEAEQILSDLKVYEPGICASNTWMGGDTIYGACRNYNEDGEYMNLDCNYCVGGGPSAPPYYNPTDITDFSPYMTTNIGGGLLRAGNMFDHQTREDALWIVILLTDGLANATDMLPSDDITDIYTYPIGFCPDWTNLCQDDNVSSRHSIAQPNYDADDYARDMADFVGCFSNNPAAGCPVEGGQGAIIFTIGLGEEVQNTYTEVSGRPYGASLLRYIAAVGYDGNPNTDLCENVSDYEESCGNYFFAPEGGQLDEVFEAIASRIFTRLTR
jgi:hypothetical protein